MGGPFGFGWIHEMIRKRTKPIPAFRAAEWRYRLSASYAFISIGLFLCVSYDVVKRKGDWIQPANGIEITPEEWVNAINTPPATIKVYKWRPGKELEHYEFEHKRE